jgi:protein-L-isoaspartate(D-aspartate) O-methyltransferase
MATSSPLEHAKLRFLDDLKEAGITARSVLDAIKKVPREAFLPPAFQAAAYENRALPIGEGQTISQPYIVALMTHALDVQPAHKVLEVGTGSGYQAAILCKLARRVYSIERFATLAAGADKLLAGLSITNFVGKVGDGSLGWPEQAPFDRIMVTAASPKVPQPLLDQLKEGGLLVIPIGPQEGEQRLMRYYKRNDGTIGEYFLGNVRFVPLVGKEGQPAKTKTA